MYKVQLTYLPITSLKFTSYSWVWSVWCLLVWTSWILQQLKHLMQKIFDKPNCFSLWIFLRDKGMSHLKHHNSLASVFISTILRPQSVKICSWTLDLLYSASYVLFLVVLIKRVENFPNCARKLCRFIWDMFTNK